MGYRATCMSGYFGVTKDNLFKVEEILADVLSLDYEVTTPVDNGIAHIDVYGGPYENYHQEEYKPLAELVIEGELYFDGDESEVWTLRFKDGEMTDPSGRIFYNEEEMNAEAKRVEVPLGDNWTLVAEKNPEKDYKEIFIYLRDEKTGLAHQDLAIVGANYRYGNDDSIEVIDGSYSVKVYADPEDEDFTHDFNFGRYEREEA